MNPRILVAGALALVALVACRAHAQTATSTTVDLRPFLDAVVWPLLTAVIGVLAPILAAYVARKVGRWLNLQSDDVLRDVIETAISNGIALAKAKLADRAVRIDTKSDAVAEAVRYAMQHAPDALRAMKVTPEKLHEAVQARLEKEFQSLPVAPNTEEVKP